MAPQKGVTLDWRLISIIGTVVICSFSIFSWFERKFHDFELDLDQKYVVKEELQDASILLHLRMTTTILANLDMVEEELAKVSNNDPEIAKAFGRRIRSIRKESAEHVKEYIKNDLQ